MSESLDAFLAPRNQPPAPAQPVVEAEIVAVEPVVEAVESTPEPAVEVEPPAPVVPSHDEDGEPVPTTGTVPVSVLQAEREKRKDWKSQAIKAAAEKEAAAEQLKALQAQLDELKKAPPPAPPAPPAPVAAPVALDQAAAAQVQPDPMPHPAEDPEGFANWQQRQIARVAEQQARLEFNSRLDRTEEALRDKEGDEAVDRATADFKAMVAAEEATFGKGRSPLAQTLTVQRNPYRWMYSVVKKAEADREIGGDLSAYKAKTEAELRAKVEAEIRERLEAEFAEKTAAAQAAAASQIAIPAVPVKTAPANVVLPKSLATATSAAPRSAPAWTGPTALADIVARR